MFVKFGGMNMILELEDSILELILFDATKNRNNADSINPENVDHLPASAKSLIQLSHVNRQFQRVCV